MFRNKFLSGSLILIYSEVYIQLNRRVRLSNSFGWLLFVPFGRFVGLMGTRRDALAPWQSYPETKNDFKLFFL